MASSAGKKTGNIIVWIILLLLIVGLAGFGASNFGGSTGNIGAVGDEEIDINDYARALQNALRAEEAAQGRPITVSEAEATGLAAQVRQQLIASAALDNEVKRIGLSVGDEQVRTQVLQIPAFQGIDGTFDREAYGFTLEQNGLSEAEFEAQIRKETARTLLQGGIVAGVSAPAAYTETLLTYFAARRSYSLIQLDETTLDTPVGTPDDAALQAYYDANAETFTAPETKAITYAWLTPDMILDTVEIDDDTLRELYDQRIDEFVQPERRLVERLVFGTADEAQAAADRLNSGEVTFEALVEDRGLALSDIDLGDVVQSDLGAAGAAIFALTDPGVSGPHDTDLGPALFRMNAVLAARETSFEDARADLRPEAALDRARRIIADAITDIDDRLAAGATIEELATETEMELGQIAYFPGMVDDIAAYDAFRDAADQARTDDFPEVAELEDGGIFALRLDEVTPPALRPLDDVREAAIAGWQAAETRAQLAQQAEALLARLNAGEAIDSFGLDVATHEGLTRGGVNPVGLVEPLFALDEGAATVVDDGANVYLLRLDGTLPPDTEDQASDFLMNAMASQAAQGIAQDLFTGFSQALVQSGGLSLNQAAINAVHAQFP